MGNLVKNLISGADASRRPDGSDIPLGAVLRDAAAEITRLSEEVERLKGERNEWQSATMEARFGCRQRSEAISAWRRRSEAAERRAEAAEARVKVLEKMLNDAVYLAKNSNLKRGIEHLEKQLSALSLHTQEKM